MASVRAFQPRKYDPPQFVAEDEDELREKLGEFIHGEQCDGCGNSTYAIETAAPDAHRPFVARCAVDPEDDPEFIHPAPCGAVYLIRLWEEDEVTF